MFAVAVFELIIILVLSVLLLRSLKADGQMIVREDDEKKLYTLEALDLDALDKKSRAVFKIVRD